MVSEPAAASRAREERRRGPSLRAWRLIHKWASLICTVFLLLLCLTGLPLIFKDEIDELTRQDVTAPVLVDAPATLDLDVLLTTVRREQTPEVPLFVFWPAADHVIGIGMGPSHEAGLDRIHRRFFDERTAAVLADRSPPAGPMQFLLRLHRELLIGPIGTWMLCGMGVLFLAATVSGVVLYGPFMRRLAFGTVRRDRHSRTKWLDLHNLLGIVAVAWVLVVASTGVMNTLERTLFATWSAQTRPALLEPYRDKPMPQKLSSASAALAAARDAFPGMRATSIALPQTRFATPRHYLVWLRGETPLTSRLFNTVLIDAETGAVAAARGLPWYLRALELSRPLHFGDYGGLPLKLLWALFDLAAIAVLVSGLYLWRPTRRSPAVASRPPATVPSSSHDDPVPVTGIGAGIAAKTVTIWRWPLALAGLSVFGVLAALIGQGGVWWPLSWTALAATLGAGVTRLYWTSRVSQGQSPG